MIFSWIQSHFQRHQQRTKAAFLWRVSLEGLVVPMILAGVVALFWEVPVRDDFDLSQVSWQLFVSIVVFAPFFETLIFQALPVMIARSCRFSFWSQVLASVLPFAAVHFLINWSTGLFAGVMSGFYLAFTYARWRQVSFRSALWMTAGMHAIHNGFLVFAALLGERFA
ncbi:MAG: CPBP family glutamic-type intramembrane protease [Opitutaceae bacterium]